MTSAEAGEEADLLHDAVQVVADRLRRALPPVCQSVLSRAAEREPGAAQRGQPRAEDGGPGRLAGAAQDQAAENGARLRAGSPARGGRWCR